LKNKFNNNDSNEKNNNLWKIKLIIKIQITKIITIFEKELNFNIKQYEKFFLIIKKWIKMVNNFFFNI
jgi:hypothetical protein